MARKKISKKTLALFVARFATGLLGTAAALALWSAVAFIPWPKYGVSAPVALVNPTSDDQLKACPGPLLALGIDPTQVNVASSFGPTTLESSGDDTQQLETEDPAASINGAPVALSAPADGEPLAGAQAQIAAIETLSGLAAATCSRPTAEAWLVGGGTELGRTTLLMLANPTEVAAKVTISLFGSEGPIEAVGLDQIVVEPGEQQVLPLAGFAIDEKSPVVHVSSEGGRIAAALQFDQIEGLTPEGSEYIAPGAQPATVLSIPGVVVDASQGSAEHQEHDDGTATLRILAPGDTDATVKVSVQGDSGAPGAQFTTDVVAGVVANFSLAGLTPGTYSVTVTGDAPLVAAVSSSVTAAEGTDLAWFASVDALAGAATFAVPNVAPATLHLTNPTESDANVTLSGPASKEVVVPAQSSISVVVESGIWKMEGTAGLLGSVSLQSPGRLASYPVPGPNAEDATVSIYTR